MAPGAKTQQCREHLFTACLANQFAQPGTGTAGYWRLPYNSHQTPSCILCHGKCGNNIIFCERGSFISSSEWKLRTQHSHPDCIKAVSGALRRNWSHSCLWCPKGDVQAEAAALGFSDNRARQETWPHMRQQHTGPGSGRHAMVMCGCSAPCPHPCHVAPNCLRTVPYPVPIPARGQSLWESCTCCTTHDNFQSDKRTWSLHRTCRMRKIARKRIRAQVPTG